MHAWLCENPIGVDALTWKELPTPAPRAGEVLIAIRAASLNFPDLLIVQNKYQMKPPLPFVPGSEYAGIVEAVGDAVTHLQVRAQLLVDMVMIALTEQVQIEIGEGRGHNKLKCVYGSQLFLHNTARPPGFPITAPV